MYYFQYVPSTKRHLAPNSRRNDDSDWLKSCCCSYNSCTYRTEDKLAVVHVLSSVRQPRYRYSYAGDSQSATLTEPSVQQQPGKQKKICSLFSLLGIASSARIFKPRSSVHICVLGFSNAPQDISKSNGIERLLGRLCCGHLHHVL